MRFTPRGWIYIYYAQIKIYSFGYKFGKKIFSEVSLCWTIFVFNIYEF